MNFPDYRPRRLRKNENFRRMIRETKLSVDNLIYPLFAVPGTKVKKPIVSMPGIFQMSVDHLVREAAAGEGRWGSRRSCSSGSPRRRTRSPPGRWRRTGSSSRRSGRSRRRSPISSSSPTSASANTRVTATAGCSKRARWQTTPPWRSWRRRPSPTRRRGRTWSPRRR